ncbi:hypothetical protein GCM10010344_25310 [Streptomyces bluensis]|nr:hypothetical protein GCM10010344_25310 [Streptomyces bluensis]
MAAAVSPATNPELLLATFCAHLSYLSTALMFLPVRRPDVSVVFDVSESCTSFEQVFVKSSW